MLQLPVNEPLLLTSYTVWNGLKLRLSRKARKRGGGTMSSNGEMAEKTLTPFVVWAQRKDMILLRVNLHPLEVTYVLITSTTHWTVLNMVCCTET